MRVKLIVSAALAACVLAGCANALPRSAANVSLCTTLAKVLDGRVSPQALAGLVFDSNAPVSHRLRQDAATFVAQVVQSGMAAAHGSAVKVESECASIHAPVATTYG